MCASFTMEIDIFTIQRHKIQANSQQTWDIEPILLNMLNGGPPSIHNATLTRDYHFMDQHLLTMGSILHMGGVPGNTIPWINVDLKLAHRPRRWPNVKQTLAQCIVFSNAHTKTVIRFNPCPTSVDWLSLKPPYCCVWCCVFGSDVGENDSRYHSLAI